MAKSRFGLGLLVGGLAGYYFSTAKGQETLGKLKEQVAEFQDNPEAYQEKVWAYVDQLSHQVGRFFDESEEIVSEFSSALTEELAEDEQDVVSKDIVIDYEAEL